MKKILSIAFVFLSLVVFSSHNRSGEITYRRVPPYTSVVGGVIVPTYSYVITVIRYTDDATTFQGTGDIADRCVDTISFGDGIKEAVPRMNGGTPLCSGCAGCGCDHCGELISTEAGFRVKKNIYQSTHVFPGPGTYLIRSFDPNRNADIANIPNSDLQPFYIESLLVINDFTGANTSPQFLYDPIDRACVFKCFTHNPGAYDPDGDSLSYELTVPRGVNASPIANYTLPDPGPGGIMNINAITGLVTWCSPQRIGQFNIAFLVKEWRKNTSGVYQVIGYVLRDMQVNVEACPNNNPPVVIVPADTCVEAGTLVTKKIRVTDPDIGNFVTLQGHTGGFSAPPPVATLTNTSAVISTSSGFLANFSWQTTCDHVRNQVYENVFKAVDNGSPIELATYSSFNIKVIPPSIKNVTATPIGTTIKVEWQLSPCSPALNPLVTYNVYRKNDCAPYVQVPCQTGVSLSSGFVFIGQSNAATNFFIDDNNGNGLVIGQNYSYLVVAEYSDGSETSASTQVCTRLRRDLPLLLNVDVRSTSASNGSIYVRWAPPLTTAGNFDTLALPGPYTVIVKYRNTDSANFTPVLTSTAQQFYQMATSFTHSNINTTDTNKIYGLDFIAGQVSIGSSQLASSVFLTTVPGDRKVHLSWTSRVPWINNKYIIWRKDPGSSTFVKIDSTSLTQYVDSATATNILVNRNTYCYKILAVGAYSDPSVVNPLLNYSQEVCALTKDLTPPCTPTLNVVADCAAGTATVTWGDVRTLSCGDDVVNYILYYKPTIDAAYAPVANGLMTLYKYDGSSNDSLISGCYAIQAVDSSNNVSLMSPDFCLDNCPIFELPNIFTPNSDAVNDFFQAIRVRQIKRIDLTVFDRWGNTVYKTTDPYFHWNGISTITNQPVSEGTFFYLCDVFENRLKGLSKRTLKGFVQVMR